MTYKKISETELEEEFVSVEAVAEVKKKRKITKEELLEAIAYAEEKLKLFK